MKQCKVCGTTEDMATRSLLCKTHHREYTRQHYQENKQAYLDKARKNDAKYIEASRQHVREYLSTHHCVDCGNDDFRVLEFDHRDPTSKVTEVTMLFAHSKQKLIEEIAKCDVRCANCHRIRTGEQFGTWRNAFVTQGTE